MLLNSNFVLKHSAWLKMRELYPAQGETKPKIALFPRLIDLFIVACTIGMRNSERVPNDMSDDVAAEINSKTYNDPVNDDIKRTLDYLLKILILTMDIPELDKYDRSTKEKLAFAADFNVEKFNAASILCEYANAGVLKIAELITDQDTETLNNIVSYITDLKNSNESLPDIDDFDNI